jgi:hypothetical protein
VELEPWHLDYFMPDEAADISFRAMGRTLIASDGTPLGFSAVYFKENGKGEAVAIVVFYGGPNQYFMRKYLPMILRGMTECVHILKRIGVTHVYAVCDRRVPDAEKFVRWMGGEILPDAEDPNGPVAILHLDKYRLIGKEIPCPSEQS